MIVIYGNSTMKRFGNPYNGPMYISHIVINLTWMSLHIWQMLTLYYWIKYIKIYNGYLIEAAICI